MFKTHNKLETLVRVPFGMLFVFRIVVYFTVHGLIFHLREPIICLDKDLKISKLKKPVQSVFSTSKRQ